MKSKVIFTMVVAATLLSCSDNVVSRYATRTDAEADHLFERGWLPPIIPESAKDIQVSIDLDLNVSSGEFVFNPADAPIFLSKLASIETPPNATKSKPYVLYRLDQNKYRWDFSIDAHSGHCRYKMTQQQTNHPQ